MGFCNYVLEFLCVTLRTNNFARFTRAEKPISKRNTDYKCKQNKFFFIKNSLGFVRIITKTRNAFLKRERKNFF